MTDADGSASANGRGHDAEEAAARKYGLKGADERTGYYDLYATNGTHYQVKSTTYRRANQSFGRFRFWKESLEKLDNERSAVILVLTASAESQSNRVLQVEKVSTSKVLEEIGGGWYRSGHADGMGKQYQLPWPDLLRPRYG